MNKETITLHEAENDGRTIYLYYDDMAGMYLAFGLSAYYTTMVTEPYISYSETVQQPVAMFQREHILQLRQGLKKMEHVEKSFYRFQMRAIVGDAGYERWMRRIQDKHEKIYRRKTV